MLAAVAGGRVSGWVRRGAAWIVDDRWWELIAPLLLLPPWPTRAPGPRPVDDRRCRQPMLFGRRTGIGGADLPQQVGFGFGLTCGRRRRRWSAAGVCDRWHRLLLAERTAAGAIDWSRALAAAAHRREGGAGVGPAPVDRARPGATHQLSCHGGGLPRPVMTTGGTVHHATKAIALRDGVPPIAGRPGRPRPRCDVLRADQG